MSLSRRQFGQLIGMGAFGMAMASAPATFAQDNKVLRLGLNTSDIGTMDPHYASGGQDRAAVDMIFSGLVRFVPGRSDEFEPDLAEALPENVINDDGTQTWSFTLREGVKTHAIEGVESVELTVDDLIFSFTKAADQEQSAFAGDYTGWSFAAGEGEREFLITLEVPVSAALFLPKVGNYSGGYIIPQVPYESIGAESFPTKPVGTGPFAFSEHNPQLDVQLVAHPEFYRGAPQLDGATIVFQADSTSRELALLSGDLDTIYGLHEAEWADRMNAEEGFTADIFGVGEASWINLDTQHEILSDPRVREAIILSIDRDNHVALSGEPVSEKLFSIVPHNLMPGGMNEEQAEEAGVNYQQDIERAKELLAEAGYPDGFDLELVTSEQLPYRQRYEILQEELRQIGINATVEVVQHATMHDLIREGRNAIVVYNAFRPSADSYLTQFFASDGGATNFSKFTVDELRDQARAETDDEAQAELWRQANIEIYKNFAGYALSITNLVWVRRSEVDYGHELVAVPQLYPGVTENTTMNAE